MQVLIIPRKDAGFDNSEKRRRGEGGSLFACAWCSDLIAERAAKRAD